jgi:hypothetical protein
VGGKGHEFVVAVLGVGARPQGVADDRVFIDAGQPCGLTDAAAVLEVLEDGEGLILGEAGAEEGTPFALREACLAGAAGEHPALSAGAITEADAEVVTAAQAIVGAVRVLAAKEAEVVHGRDSQRGGW